MSDPIKNKNIALGVTGSIACYKAPDLASKLTQSGALVDVIMTKGSTNFLKPLTFQSITHRPVITDMFAPNSESSIDHVAIAQRADIVAVVPCTAQTIAKLACGLADNAVTATILATQSPVILAPAMDANMYDNPATQENIEKLLSRGYLITGPSHGHLASGLVGKGRLLEIWKILEHMRMILGRKGDLTNRKVVVSAGGTQEPLDPVRYLGNFSSGKMGYAISKAARDRGASTVLISAPTSLPDPIGVKVIRIQTALQMRDVIREECRDAHALIMAAAVADWRASEVPEHKIKKNDAAVWSPQLIRNPDVLAEMRDIHIVKVGFAAESTNLLENAQSKLVNKGLDLIAANDITKQDSGFSSDTNKVFLIDQKGNTEDLPKMNKYDVGHRILDRVASILT